jgi:uncharacterized protein YdbL (DUF1318 family)
MNTRRTFIAALIALFLLPATALFAAESKAELQKRFKARYAEIQQLKKDAVVGETDEGYIDFVNDKKDAKHTDLVDQENTDRRALYALIAKDTGESAETVAKHNAQRNFEKAKSGEWIKVDGKWKKKA